MNDDAPSTGATTTGDAAVTEQGSPSAKHTEPKGSAIWREIKGLLWVLVAQRRSADDSMRFIDDGTLGHRTLDDRT